VCGYNFRDTTYGICVSHEDLFLTKTMRLVVYQPLSSSLPSLDIPSSSSSSSKDTINEGEGEVETRVMDLKDTKLQDEKGLGARAVRILRGLEKVENQMNRDKARLAMHSSSKDYYYHPFYQTNSSFYFHIK